MGGGASTSRRVNVMSADGKNRKVVTFSKKAAFDSVKEMFAEKVYGLAGRNHSAAFIKLKARNTHGDFDIDDLASVPYGDASLVVVQLIQAEGAIKRGLTPQFALPEPDGGAKAESKVPDAKLPDVERMSALPKGGRPDKLFPMVVMGATATGKTSLIHRYSVGQYSPTFISTMGVSCEFVNLKIGDVTIKIRITDTAGQDIFRSIAESHLPSAKGVLIVFDVTDRSSYEKVKDLIGRIKKINKQLVADSCVLVVGNKVDLTFNRCVTSREAGLLCAELGCPYFETSARDSIGIDPPFQYLATRLLNLYPKELSNFQLQSAQRGTGAGSGAGAGTRFFRCAVM